MATTTRATLGRSNAERPDGQYAFLTGLYVAALVAPALVLALSRIVTDAAVLYVGFLVAVTGVTAVAGWAVSRTPGLAVSLGRHDAVRLFVVVPFGWFGGVFPLVDSARRTSYHPPDTERITIGPRYEPIRDGSWVEPLFVADALLVGRRQVSPVRSTANPITGASTGLMLNCSLARAMDVLMTGPYGRVGNALRKHLDGREEYFFTYLDVRDHPDVETVVADVTDYGAIRPAFEGQDAVVHLALDPHMGSQHTDPEWLDALQRELEGTVNVFRAAVEAGVETVVYATTHQLVEPYVLNHPSPEDDDFVVDHTVPTRPYSLYSVVKAFGEQFARFCTEAHDLRFYGLRIGWVMAPDEDHPYARAEQGVEEGEWERGSEAYEASVARQKWLSHRDAAHLVDCCLQDDTVEYDLFYGVSDNEGRYYDIDHAREVLDYDPQDDFAEWDGPPG